MQRHHERGNDICAHQGCNCPTREHSKYCSPYCEAAGDTLELACGCGHAGCGTDGTFKEEEREEEVTPELA